jgi:hypothetical protein
MFRAFWCAEKLVEFELDGGRVAVLGVLEKEHHQEGDDGRAGIDDQLRGVGVVKEGSCNSSGNDQYNGRHEDAGAAALSSRPVSGLRKQVRHTASGLYLFVPAGMDIGLKPDYARRACTASAQAHLIAGAPFTARASRREFPRLERPRSGG